MFEAEFDELRRRAEDLEDVRLLSLHQPETCKADALLRSVLPIQELEAAHTQLEAQKTSIETFKDEREELLDEREELHKQLDRVEGGQSNRSMSRAGNEDFDRVRPPLPLTFALLFLYLCCSRPGQLLFLQERNELRDRLASAGLELEKKESLLEEKERALQEAYAELDGVDQQWANEVKVTKAQNEELKDVSRLSVNRIETSYLTPCVVSSTGPARVREGERSSARRGPGTPGGDCRPAGQAGRTRGSQHGAG